MNNPRHCPRRPPIEPAARWRFTPNDCQEKPNSPKKFHWFPSLPVELTSTFLKSRGQDSNLHFANALGDQTLLRWLPRAKLPLLYPIELPRKIQLTVDSVSTGFVVLMGDVHH